MAESTSKTEDSAEKAYAAASADVKADKAEATAPAKASPAAKAPATKAAAAPKATKAKAAAPKKPVAAKKAPAKKAPAKKAPAKKPVAAKTASPAAKPVAAKKTVAKKSAAKTTPAKPVKVAAAKTETKTPTVTELKDIMMSTEFTTDFTESMTDAVAEMQDRFQQAYDKSQSVVAEMTDLAKGNVEAIVESGKILAGGLQDMGKTYADEAKTAYETATADIKEMAAVKSPTELFQLQGKIMRRNFDSLVATASKNTDAAIKLANETVAPITGRVNLAAEKLSTVA